MKLQNLSVIFIIIVIPIILVISYYISMQVDTINMQTAYNTKLLQATKQAIEAFEINTVEWNEAYSQTADSKRRDIMASVNTFTTSFANATGVGGASKENILPYIPAIAFTLYDGYYIYSPAEVKEVVKDKNGVAVFMSKELADSIGCTYRESDKGKLLYEYDSENEAGINPDGTYNGIQFTLNEKGSKSTYSHILKPFSTYSARYKNGNTDIVINYTLDNYITISGIVDGDYVIKSGYLIDVTTKPDGIVTENLSEKIAWRRNENEAYTCEKYPYIYAEDNTKVYFEGDVPFQVNSTGIRTDLNQLSNVKYKKLSQSGETYYQALTNYDVNEDEEINENEDIIAGNWYKKKGDISSQKDINIEMYDDVSAINYYEENIAFSTWVYEKLNNKTVITVENMQSRTEDITVEGKIFDNPESEDSVFNWHKREVIKQTLISNLNQAITSYSRNSAGDFSLPVLSETDWDQILSNVSIITFVQGIPIGMKEYNNYAIATSTSNKEYVDPDEIYLNTTSNTDNYYHLPYCKEINEESNLIGYRSIDYRIKSYEYVDDDGTKKTGYFYKHENLAKEECYYCLLQIFLYKQKKNDSKIIAYETALAREKYIAKATTNNYVKTVEEMVNNKFKVTFICRYWNYPSESFIEERDTIEVVPGEKIPYNPREDDEDFIAWYKDTTFTNEFDLNTPINQDIVSNAGELFLYGKFGKTCDVNFYAIAENGDEKLIDKLEVLEGEKINSLNVPIISPNINDEEKTITKYEVRGWYKDKEYKTKFDIYNEQIWYNIDLYAEINKTTEDYGEMHKVTFKDGNKTIKEIYVKEGKNISDEDIPLPQRAYTNNIKSVTDYVFEGKYEKNPNKKEGWYEDTGFNTKFNFSTPITEDITIYAKFINIEYSWGRYTLALGSWTISEGYCIDIMFKNDNGDNLSNNMGDNDVKVRQIDKLEGDLIDIGIFPHTFKPKDKGVYKRIDTNPEVSELLEKNGKDILEISFKYNGNDYKLKVPKIPGDPPKY